MLYAHSVEGKPQEEWQPLEEHLKKVAEKAAGFAEPFGSADWAWNAGWLHDVGKADSAFQEYLRRENDLDDTEYDKGRVNHSSAGAALAEDQLGPFGRILAYLVAGHHAGLPDWCSADSGMAALSARLPEGQENLSRIQSFVELASGNFRKTNRPGHVNADNFHLWVRMLYSCLVDADFLNTEAYLNLENAGLRGGYKKLGDLKTKFDEHMALFRPTTPVNIIRNEILVVCRQAASQKPGLFSLTVPTGGGKTLSGMAFALEHAIKHGKERIIYVIPYTSIIEQTAATLSEIFGSDNVVEHHSNLDPEKETERSRLASENWDAPIVVTTNVQFFESLYAARSSRCRKLHNIVNSVVILDEAQLLPPAWLAPCVDVMSQLANHYGVTLVLSTATQPALSTLPKPCPCLASPTEIIPSGMNLYERLKRTEILIPRDLNERTSWKDLAARLLESKQVLCVVNTRRDCYDLFKLMPEGTIHLSVLMCGKHRSEVIAGIKQRLKDGLPTRVISTQLVEAGVDIDFQVVYRALAGLDSIAQAAGRCNREGKLNDEGRLGKVRVFVPVKDAPRGLLLKGANKSREIFSLPGIDLQNPETFTRYFEIFYSAVNDTGAEWLRNNLVNDVNPDLACQFRTAAVEFKMIDDQAQQSVIVRFGESERLINQLRFAGPTREIMRKLQRYSVTLPVRMIETMLGRGLLERADPKAPDIIVQSSLKLYDEKVGLDVYRENLPIEDLIV